MSLYLIGALFALTSTYCFSIGAYHSWRATFVGKFNPTHLTHFGLCIFAAAVSFLVGAGSLVSAGYLALFG